MPGYRLTDLKPAFGDVALMQKPVDAGLSLALILAASDGVQQPA